MIIFGPVPSRRLGKSIGINNIPPKICTYSCIYCQVGRTKKMTTKKQNFYSIDKILREVDNKINNMNKKGEKIDYLTFVSDGEPTLDIKLGCIINALKVFGIKIAVITNSSLIWEKEVQENLMQADLVSLKVDSVLQKIWKKINRPEKNLKIKKILTGILEFCKNFSQKIITETMLIKNINVNSETIKSTAEFIQKLSPNIAYISIPTRPPSETWAKPPDEKSLNNAYQIFSNAMINTELLIGYEGNTFASTGNIENDLLSITAVHPMRKDAVEKLLLKTNATWDSVKKLIEQKKITQSKHNGNFFYNRTFTKFSNLKL